MRQHGTFDGMPCISAECISRCFFYKFADFVRETSVILVQGKLYRYYDLSIPRSRQLHSKRKHLHRQLSHSVLCVEIEPVSRGIRCECYSSCARYALVSSACRCTIFFTCWSLLRLRGQGAFVPSLAARLTRRYHVFVRNALFLSKHNKSTLPTAAW